MVSGRRWCGSALNAGDEIVATVLDDREAQVVAEAHGQAVSTHRLDLGKPEMVGAALRAILADTGPIDAIIVCVAISPYGPAETTPLEIFRRTLDINVLSAVAIYQAAMPVLRASRGRLVLISSMAGKAAMPFIGAYVTSKFALEGLADVLRREAAPQGVSVSVVEPGGIRTGMVDEQLRTIVERIAALSEEEDARYGKLYRQFQTLATQSDRETASTADDVAAVIARALDDAMPAPRYIAGADAEQLIGAGEGVGRRRTRRCLRADVRSGAGLRPAGLRDGPSFALAPALDER